MHCKLNMWLILCRGWRIALVDQRNHGHTADIAGFAPPHTMQAAAQDLLHFVQQKYGNQQLNVVAGHSLGGKTTLEFLNQVSQTGSPVRPPQQVEIAPCGPLYLAIHKLPPSCTRPTMLSGRLLTIMRAWIGCFGASSHQYCCAAVYAAAAAAFTCMSSQLRLNNLF